MKMSASEPLSRFPLIRATKIDELEEAFSRISIGASIEAGHPADNFEAAVNNCQLQHIGLAYEKYSGARLNIPETNFFSQAFPLGGKGEIRAAETQAPEIDGKLTVLSPGMSVKMEFMTDYEHLAMRIAPSALIRKLTAIIDAPVGTPLRMDSIQNSSRPDARVLRDLFLFVVAQVDARDGLLPPLILAEWEQALMVAYLAANRHNYSHLLEGQPTGVAPWQVRRAEDYIEANWNRPIRVEDLAALTGTSARSLFRTFQKSRGCSPMTFAKQVRLRHAHQLLRAPHKTTTVTDVALACGFGSLGRFSMDYYRAFGELPSHTLKRG
jgi:AraC-like DNA-binding protein